MRTAQTHYLNLSDSDVSITYENTVGRVGYQPAWTEIIFNVSLKIDEDTNVLDLFEYSSKSSLEVPCVHIIVLHHCFTLGCRKNLPSVMKLVHQHRSAMKLRLQYEKAPNNLVYFSELYSTFTLPGSIPSRTGRPRTRRSVKVRTTKSFRHCQEHDHNVANCPLITKTCSRCKLKGHTETTCNTPLDAFGRALVGHDKTAEIERQSLVHAYDTAARREILRSSSQQQVHVPHSPGHDLPSHQHAPPLCGAPSSDNLVAPSH